MSQHAYMHKAASNEGAMILDLDGVKAAAREAYDNSLLTAQAPARHNRVCVYYIKCDDDIERFCAIGAYLPVAWAKEHASSGVIPAPPSIGTNRRFRYKGSNERALGDYQALFRIQQAHDDWAAKMYRQLSATEQVRKQQEAEAEHARNYFLSLIEHPNPPKQMQE